MTVRITPMPRKRRGMTLTEVIIGGAFTLVIVTIMAAMSSASNRLWHRAQAQRSSTDILSLAIQRMSPDVRPARRVVTAQSTSTTLTVVLPLAGGGGGYVAPVADGDTVKFYLSNLTGNAGVASGTILWRSVNGTKDTAWSLNSTQSRGRLDLGVANSLNFTYSQPSNPQSVTVSVTTSKQSGTQTITGTASSEMELRNWE